MNAPSNVAGAESGCLGWSNFRFSPPPLLQCGVSACYLLACAAATQQYTLFTMHVICRPYLWCLVSFAGAHECAG